MSHIVITHSGGNEAVVSYMSALLEGRAEDASKDLDRVLREGWSILRIYQDMMTPALRLVGDLWEKGRIGVATEHRAVQITLDQMARIRGRFEPGESSGKHVLVTTPPGELHHVGARMIADFFDLNGLDVDFLGPDTPVAEIVEYVQHRELDLVALSVTQSSGLKGAEAVIRGLRKKSRRVPVLLGGLAAAAAGSWKKEVRPDATAEDPLQGFTEACRLLRLDRGTISFSTLLKRVGRQIETLRKARRWNQQDLAERTGLDRTYISALEHGRQNATIKVLLKLAEAFEVPLDTLFAGRSRSVPGE